MDDFDDFEVVFGSSPNAAYEKETQDQISRNRQLLENELFVDRLLKALGIPKVSQFYPPQTNQGLRNLHEKVTSSSSPDHYKHSVLYYFLKDIENYSHQPPTRFAQASYLPRRYQTFIDGIWYLDRLRCERALDHLTEPALIPTFPEEILYTLCRHASPNDVTLPLAYYHSVTPPISSFKVLEMYFQTLCRASITEAFYFSRAQGDLNHRALLEKLVAFVHSDSYGAIKATRGVELISLPLHEEEESWLEEYLEEGSGKALNGAMDTLIMRRIASGRLKSKPQERGSSSSREAKYKLDKTNITNDLSQERPQWILSAYGPGRDAPLQLFGGFPREQSFEEMRIRHYELAAQGNQQLAVQEAQTLVSNAEQQIQTTLNNIDGAIKYIIDGENEHPNRIDICKAKGASPAPPLDFRSNQEPTSTLVQPSCSAPAFGQLSAPSIFDRPLGPALGQTSVPKSSFGQPTTSTFGQPSAFGQPATLGRPTTSFGQPSTFGKPSNPSTAFGQPSAPTLFQTPQQNPSPFNAPLGPNVNAQTSSTTNNPFGQSLAPAQPNLFGQPPAPSQPNVFGKPSTPNIPITFGQPQLSEGGFPPNTTGSANGLGQTIAPTTDSFGQPFTAAPNTFAQRRSSQVAAANVPVPSFGHQSAPDSSRPSSGPSLNGTASRTLSGHETNGVQIQKDEQGNIKNWKGLPVSYVDGEPCCKGDDGSWQRIWFPDGPPVFTKTVDLPDEAYDEATKANYRHLREYGTFKDGVMPELPPRREWCSWSF